MSTILCPISEEPHNKTKKQVLEHLHAFISTIPVHPSHYTRSKTPLRQFMDQACTTKFLHAGYIADAESKKIDKPVKYDKFRTIFTNSYNIVSRFVC